MKTVLGLAAAATLLPALLTGCGSETGPAGPASSAEWSSATVPLEPGADSPIVLATDGDDLLVVTASEDGVVRSSRSVDGGAFETGEGRATGSRYLALGGAAPHDGGWVTLGSGGLAEVDGDGELLFEVTGLRSEDGLAWEQVEVSGFSGPADVGAVVASGDTLLAGGSYRTAADPSMGGAVATVWRSDDGVAWTEVPLPGVAGESYVADLAVDGDRVVAVGASGRGGAIWTSEDAGASWQRSDDADVEGLYAISGAAAQDGVLVVSTTPGDSGDPGMLRSDDGGETWAPAAAPPPSEGSEGFAPVWSGGGRFFTVTSSFVESWSEPGVCYADLDRCLADSVVVLHTSEDGDRWRAVDTGGIGSGEEAEVDEVTGTADGRVVAMQLRGDGVRLHTWPAGVDLPEAEEEGSAAPVELVEVPKDGELEPGVRYHAPLHLHCGMDWLHLGDEAWRRSDDGPEVETGAGDAIDPDWPVAQQTLFGYATLVDGVVEYSLDGGEVIATYEPTRQRPPGCD